MEIVSNNSEAEVAQARARDEIAWPLRELAANLMRITRGAGKPYEIGQQMDAVINAFNSYRDAFGHWPFSEDIANALSLDRHNEDRLESWDDFNWAVRTMVQGSLQHAASTLLYQNTHIAAGKSELIRGVRDLEKARAADARKPIVPFSVRDMSAEKLD